MIMIIMMMMICLIMMIMKMIKIMMNCNHHDQHCKYIWEGHLERRKFSECDPKNVAKKSFTTLAFPDVFYAFMMMIIMKMMIIMMMVIMIIIIIIHHKICRTLSQKCGPMNILQHWHSSKTFSGHS